MSSNGNNLGSVLEATVGDSYEAQGFEVVHQPKKEDLPFDLGNYRPDLLVKISPNAGYIIEVKRSASETPIDRYRDVADSVAKHKGWRFLLVTGDNISIMEPTTDDDGLLSWKQIRQRQEKADKLLALGETEGAFVTLWGALEAELRQLAKSASIPIERFPTASLINHLYSQGELSMAQFDAAKALQEIRNRFVHGYQTPSLDEPAKRLQLLVKELQPPHAEE